MLGRWVSWSWLLALALLLLPAGPTSAQTATDADKLHAEVRRLSQAGKHAEAIPLAQQVLAIRERALGTAHSDVALSLVELAVLYFAQSRLAEAEPLYKRAIAMYETAFGPEHPHVAISLDNLASLYWAQGRYSEAEQLFKRGLIIWENVRGSEHPDVAVNLNNLANLYSAQGRLAEAEPLYKRAITIFEKALGHEHRNVATVISGLASLYVHQGRYAEAEQLSKRSLTIREKELGPEHPDVARILARMGNVYLEQGRIAEAEALFERTLVIFEKVLDPDHVSLANGLSNLARLAAVQRDWVRAAQFWRRSTDIFQRRAARGLSGTAGGNEKELRQNSWYFVGLIKAAYRLVEQTPADRAGQAYGMFEAAQWAQWSDAASALSQMAARSAGGSAELAALVRERQDLVAEWHGKDKLLVAARSEPPAKRNAAAEKSLIDRLATIDVRLAAIDARLAKDFPDYAALASPKPISLADVQAALRDDEALVLFLDTVASKPPPEETFVWVVTKTDVRWLHSDLGTSALRREVVALRCGLDATAWWASNSQCPKLTGVAYSEADSKNGKPLPFDAARAHVLYKSLLGEAAPLIKGKHLLIVPSGALTTLPFQVLVTEPPAGHSLKTARWLIRKHALTVLPSVAALKSLRHTGKPSAAEKPMLGFGNPLLDGNGPADKELAVLARAQTGCAATSPQRTAALRTINRRAASVPHAAGLADLDHLRRQSPLPETADELCAVARSVGADPADVRIGARASESEIKWLSASGDLARYRIVHFATHGLLAGQLSGTREPGLILTPPSAATADDDGYLSASEIAALKLDADWVILSACNTAGGSGQGEAAEALSGLARVFFYAGARALLVSHWEVDSNAAVKLVTSAVGAMGKDKSLGRAEALRRAMLAVMADTSRPDHWVPAWHPSVWAPFVVVGEGGAGR